MDRKIVEQLVTGVGVNSIARDLRVGKRRIRVLCELAKKYGQEKAADVLRNEFKLEHRADLTEEQAERYTIRLREMLEG